MDLINKLITKLELSSPMDFAGRGKWAQDLRDVLEAKAEPVKGLSDLDLESLLEASDHRVYDGEYRFDGNDLMRLLREVASYGNAAQPVHTLGGSKEEYTRVFNMGRDSAQPDLSHVGDSSFESWFSSRPFAAQPDIKQLCRDSYAAGMNDPLVRTQPDPAMAGDEWLREFHRLATEVAYGQPHTECDDNWHEMMEAHNASQERLASHAHKRVQLVSEEDTERLDWVLSNKFLRVQGSDAKGWFVLDCSDGLTFLIENAKTARDAIDAARALALPSLQHNR